MLEWAARVAAEWRHLAAHANVRTVATVDDYLALLHSHAFAVVARVSAARRDTFSWTLFSYKSFSPTRRFSDGLDCQACKTARTNLLRLSASLQGVGNESTRPLVYSHTRRTTCVRERWQKRLTVLREREREREREIERERERERGRAVRVVVCAS